MSEIATERVSIDTVGGAGAAVGSGTTIPIMGFLLDVFIDYNAAAPATTDVTISDPIFGNIVVKSNNNTDVSLAPREATVDAAAAATGLYDLYPVCSALTISVAEADALTACVVVTVRWITP